MVVGYALTMYLLPVWALQAGLTALLAPVSKVIQQVQAFREQNRSSPFFNHLSAVSESVPALGWVAMVRRRQAIWEGLGIKARVGLVVVCVCGLCFVVCV